MKPLHRNRDFLLLQAGQLLSSVGTASTTIAYPLLVLAITHSAVKAGIVAFARGVPAALFLLPAGLAADRYDRRTLMIVAGALLGAVSARATVAVFVAFALVLALWGTVSPALRGVSRV